MKPSMVIFTLLVGAFVLGDLASVGYVSATNQRWPDPPGIILLATVFSQLALIAAWFTFGRWNIVARLLIALGAVFGLALVAAKATDGGDSVALWFTILSIAFGTCAVPPWVARFLGWEIGRTDESREADRRSTWQFSIWSLLSATTAVAIAMGTSRLVDLPPLSMWEGIAFFGCVALTGLLVMVVAMGIRIPALAALASMLVVVVACPLAGLLIRQTGFPPKEHPAQWMLFGFCYGATIAVAGLVLRVAGFRLRRMKRSQPTTDVAENSDLVAKDGPQRGKVGNDILVKLPGAHAVSERRTAAPPNRLSIHTPTDDT